MVEDTEASVGYYAESSCNQDSGGERFIEIDCSLAVCHFPFLGPVVAFEKTGVWFYG